MCHETFVYLTSLDVYFKYSLYLLDRFYRGLYRWKPRKVGSIFNGLYSSEQKIRAVDIDENICSILARMNNT